MAKSAVLEIWAKIRGTAFGEFARLELADQEKRERQMAAIRQLELQRQQQERLHADTPQLQPERGR
jgi:hypothetical protein